MKRLFQPVRSMFSQQRNRDVALGLQILSEKLFMLFAHLLAIIILKR